MPPDKPTTTPVSSNPSGTSGTSDESDGGGGDSSAGLLIGIGVAVLVVCVIVGVMLVVQRQRGKAATTLAAATIGNPAYNDTPDVDYMAVLTPASPPGSGTEHDNERGAPPHTGPDPVYSNARATAKYVLRPMSRQILLVVVQYAFGFG